MIGISCGLNGNQVERLDFFKEVMFWLFLNVITIITIMANLIRLFFEETLEAQRQRSGDNETYDSDCFTNHLFD